VTVSEHAWIIPLLPAASFLFILLVGKRLPFPSSYVGIATVGASWVLSAVVGYEWITDGEVKEAATTWFTIGDFTVDVGVHVDGLAAMMLVTVSTIALLVHVYSLEYLRGDRRYVHYFAALSLFTASMLTLVLADNLLMLLTSWELVGLCSFLLISHWWEEKANSDAALKAFITNRVGDIGLIVGISILFVESGRNFNIQVINELALTGGMSHLVLLMAALSLLAAVMSKSGQFPLHIWLPDAMAGPTPVSALIHAATMVVAGVYMVARVYGVFFEGLSIEAGGINMLALTGGVTIVIGAGLAFVQHDIKKVLAYSTISQLGYMVAALGTGAWTAGVFHLFTHAFFKACLFLGAGSVSHAAHHTFDMRKMGGLRKHMPVTFTTFVVCTLALCGIPPLAGFWSKDEILLGAKEGDYPTILILGSIGAFMTAAYMGRAVYLTFFGEYRGEGTPHESPRLMTVPLLLLGVAAVGAGFLNAPGFTKFNEWVSFEVESPRYGIHGEFHLEHHVFSIPDAAISVAIACLGLGVAFLLYFQQKAPAGLTERNAAARFGYRVLVNKYYLDALMVDGVSRGTAGPVARAAYWFNQKVIDGIVNGAGKLVTVSAPLLYRFVDQGAIDGSINGSAKLTGSAGGALRLLQTGRVQRYALYLFSSVIVISLSVALFV
jgi:NADH-quinone oxidoreductase subunit L